jgi:protein MAK16
MPNKWWEKIRLSSNYATALEQLDTQLQYWPKFLVHKCKQRLTRLTQVAIRTKRLEKEQARLGETIVPKMAPKIRRRESTRERKAEAAAKVEKAIEKELIDRLVSGAYSDQPLNVDEAIWKKVLRRLESKGEGVRDEDLDDGIEEEDDEDEVEYEREEEMEGDVEYVSDIEGLSDEEDDMEDVEDYEGSEGTGVEDSDADESDEEDEDDAELKKTLAGIKRKRGDKPPPRPAKKGTKGAKVGIEYEIETEPAMREGLYA